MCRRIIFTKFYDAQLVPVVIRIRTLTFKNLRATIAHNACVLCILMYIMLARLCAGACAVGEKERGIDMQRERNTNRCVNIREHNG